MGLKGELKSFLNTHFMGLELKSPLFYNWPIGLRFDLQTKPVFTSEYFAEVTRRATVLFESAFDKNDTVIAIYTDIKKGKSKLRRHGFWFKCFSKTTIIDSAFKVIINPYYTDYRRPYWNMALLKAKAGDIDYKNMFAKLAYKDFPWMNNYDVFLLNIDKQLIYHMYDDRGLDIIGADKSTLKKIYTQHNDIILDCDRPKIDLTFKN